MQSSGIHLSTMTSGFTYCDYLRVVAQHGRSTTLPILKKFSFEDINVSVQPRKLQQHFATLVKRDEHLRARQCEVLRQVNHLFQFLHRHAFVGTI